MLSINKPGGRLHKSSEWFSKRKDGNRTDDIEHETEMGQLQIRLGCKMLCNTAAESNKWIKGSDPKYIEPDMGIGCQFGFMPGSG